MIFPSSVNAGNMCCSNNMTSSDFKPKKLCLRKNARVDSLVCSLVMIYLDKKVKKLSFFLSISEWDNE